MTPYLLGGLLVFAAFTGAFYAAAQLLRGPLEVVVARSEAAFAVRLRDQFRDRALARPAALVHGLGWVALGALAFFVTGSLLVGVGVGFLARTAPGVWIAVGADARRRAIARQLPEAVALLANSVRSGGTLREAVTLVARELSDPIRQEFAQIARDLELGTAFEAALQRARDRLQLPNFDLLTTAILVNKAKGGALPVVLLKLADSVREMHHMEERVESETAATRLSAKVMVGTIPVFGIALYLADPDGVTRMLTTLDGQAVLAAVVLCAATGYRMIVRLANPDL